MWCNEDIKWIEQNYPGLRQIDSSTFEGNLSFQMLRVNNKYYINPTDDLIKKVNEPDYLYICDSYKIKIIWDEKWSYPTTYEVGGRLASVASRLGKNLHDLHQFPANASLCLASPMDLINKFRSGFKIKEFVEDYLVPYFFAQSHYAQKQEWLWGELSHGYVGLLEWLGRLEKYTDQDSKVTYYTLFLYADKDKILELLNSRCRNHKPCPCGSGKKTRNCHSDLQVGITKIRGAISRGYIKKGDYI